MVNQRTSPCLLSKSTITGPFSIAMLVYQMVPLQKISKCAGVQSFLKASIHRSCKRDPPSLFNWQPASCSRKTINTSGNQCSWSISPYLFVDIPTLMFPFWTSTYPLLMQLKKPRCSCHTWSIGSCQNKTHQMDTSSFFPIMVYHHFFMYIIVILHHTSFSINLSIHPYPHVLAHIPT